MEIDKPVIRLAAIHEWSDELIERAVHSAGRGDVLKVLSQAAECLCLAVLRGGDPELQASGARGLGFRSFEVYQEFVRSHPTLSSRYEAAVAVEGDEGRVVAQSYTEIILEAEGGEFLAVDRTLFDGPIEAGDHVVVGFFGRPSLASTSSDQRPVARSRTN